MDEQDFFKGLKKLAEETQYLAKTANTQFGFEVSDIIHNKIVDPKQIENLLDRILDFCFDEDVLLQFKRLCRYYYYIDPRATVEYIQIYREHWDNEEDKADID